MATSAEASAGSSTPPTRPASETPETPEAPIGAGLEGLPPVITAIGVGKRFASYHERPTSLKERFVRRRSVVGEEFWALRDVEVAIAPGQTVGLIGANGSGKSTLLKVLAGILRPTLGEVHVIGRIASLLELGAGFNGELSGRDNVYLNASLLGLSRRETTALFDSVVEFAELQHKIDDPVKHYSSGQYIRLGFAIAVHVDPDVLLVDEVLAVGDEAFQKKCLDKITEFRNAGKTILFVSHSLELVEDLCDRVVVMESGRKIFDGAPANGTLVLRNRMGGGTATGGDDDTVQLTAVQFSSDPGGTARVQFDPGEQLSISVDIDVREGATDRLYLHAVVLGPHDVPVWQMETEGGIASPVGTVTVDFVVPRVPTLLGVFAVRVHVSDAYSGTPLTVRRFDDLFGIAGPQTGGLLPVDYDVRDRT
ncbi:MAG TPA: ABC transporter ATP-binding protein [Frankiaceae bacterium]|nr:ABC transporter ATP-binding protein [Frankiaceae bacterium]